MKKIEKRFEERMCVEVFYVDDAGYKVKVEIMQLSSRPDSEYGVNWSAHGTVSVIDAKNYARLIDVAIEECEKNNSLI